MQTSIQIIQIQHGKNISMQIIYDTTNMSSKYDCEE
jgi:hypothetical protein